MSDVIDHPEAPVAPGHVAIYRKDYRAPDWLVPEVSLEFELDPERSRVRSRLTGKRNGRHDRPLSLAGDGLDYSRCEWMATRRAGRWRAASWSSSYPAMKRSSIPRWR